MGVSAEVEKFYIKKAYPKLYYIPEFINEEEERALFEQVYAAPKPKWTQLSNRRLQNWGGHPHAKGMIPEKLPLIMVVVCYLFPYLAIIPMYTTLWLSLYTTKLASLGIFGDNEPNHVLVNEYKSGQGIMPHVDGPLFYPVVTTINLNSHTLLDFYHPVQENYPLDSAADGHPLKDRHFMSLLLEPRSLNILTADMYSVYLHGISERQVDVLDDKVVNLDMCSNIPVSRKLSRGTRVSLTIRYVPKVLNVKLKFGK